jgi:DNA topoisomerase-1
LGILVNDFLIKHFPDIFDISFTAKMEDELDEIVNGKLTWDSVINDFYSPFIGKLGVVFKEGERVKLDLGKVDEKCPKCGHELVIRLSKFGKFIACSNYPGCTFTKNIIEKTGIKCPRCGSEMLMKKTRKGKQFYGSYPKCNFAAWKKEDIK